MFKTIIDDKKYWEKYYDTYTEPFEPSLFANYVVENYAKKNDVIVELGCGNGRDALYFAKHKLKVYAIDQCKNEILYLSKYNNNYLQFINSDFSNVDTIFNADILYSRFTLHSICEYQENKVIKWAKKTLKTNGLFCIEVRGLKNELYGLGKQIDKNTYLYNDHIRRFIDRHELCNKLKKEGFEIVETREELGFSPTLESNETFSWIVAVLNIKETN